MKLNFQPDTQGALDAQTLVLINARGLRIELILKRNDETTYSLIAMSGISHMPAELVKGQGPYQTLDEGIAARKAIADQLLNKGFLLQDDAFSIWPIQAQKVIQTLRKERKNSQNRYQH